MKANEVRWGNRFGWTALGLVVAAVASLSTPAAAQIRLIPQIGLYSPQSDLGRVSTGATAVEVAKMESTLGIGLGLDFSPQKSLSLRLNGVYGTQASVPVRGIALCPGCEARSTVTALTGGVVFRPLPTLILVKPYLQGGAGIKRYDFDEDDARAEGVDAFVSDQNKVTGLLGVGADLNLGLARFVVELSDFISGFNTGRDADGEGERQHDFFFTIGIAIGG